MINIRIVPIKRYLRVRRGVCVAFMCRPLVRTLLI